MRSFVSVAVLALALGACNPSTPAPAADDTLMAPPVERGPPVAQEAANKADAKPAFPEQTRAPEVQSDVALKIETIAEGIENPWGSTVCRMTARCW